MNEIIFRYLISLTVNLNLDMHLMDVGAIYLYGQLDPNNYMEISYGFKILNIRENGNMYSIKLQRNYIV